MKRKSKFNRGASASERITNISHRGHSFYDKNEKLYVDCAECERGGNGTAKDKCSAGWRIKRSKKLGCFCGELIPGITPGDMRMEALSNVNVDALAHLDPTDAEGEP